MRFCWYKRIMEKIWQIKYYIQPLTHEVVYLCIHCMKLMKLDFSARFQGIKSKSDERHLSSSISIIVYYDVKSYSRNWLAKRREHCIANLNFSDLSIFVLISLPDSPEMKSTIFQIRTSISISINRIPKTFRNDSSFSSPE